MKNLLNEGVMKGNIKSSANLIQKPIKPPPSPKGNNKQKYFEKKSENNCLQIKISLIY